MDAVCLGTVSGHLPTVLLSASGHRYMQFDALRACIMDVHYGTVTWSDSGRSLSVLRLIVVVVYTWSATVMSAAWQNVTVIKPRGVQQRLMNSSKVDGQRSAVVRLSELWNGWADGGSTDCRPLSVTSSSKCRNPRAVCRATVVAAWLPATSATAAEVSCTTKPTAQIEPKSLVVTLIVTSPDRQHSS